MEFDDENFFDVETSNNHEKDDLNSKIKHYFDGRIVRKDLTKKIKEGANVPIYVLEYLFLLSKLTEDSFLTLPEKLETKDKIALSVILPPITLPSL